LKKVQTLSGAKEGTFLAELKDYRTLLKESFNNITQDRLDIDALIKETNRILSTNNVNLQISHNDENYQLDFYPHDESKNMFLSIIAIQTAQLLSSTEFQNLKKCDNNNCALYFIDTSKNHSRRWCSMEVCGNRAKVSSFLKRAKKSC
jgi:predicted RNA-binding Zn ribbon-like protein